MKANGPKTLIVGDSGTGKTYAALMAAALTGRQVFVLFCEPGMATINALPTEVKAKLGKSLFYCYVPVSSSLENLTSAAELVNKIDFQGLTQAPDKGKAQAQEYSNIMKALSNFKDDKTGQEFGNVQDWKDDRILVIDSLSGLSTAAWRNHKGDSVTANQGNYQIVQKCLENFLTWFCARLRCGGIITAHETRETNEVTNASNIYPAIPGIKLAPLVGRNFDDVVRSIKEEGKYFWSTTSRGFASKVRYLKDGANITPNFEAIYKAYDDLNKDETP